DRAVLVRLRRVADPPCELPRVGGVASVPPASRAARPVPGSTRSAPYRSRARHDDYTVDIPQSQILLAAALAPNDPYRGVARLGSTRVGWDRGQIRRSPQ